MSRNSTSGRAGKDRASLYAEITDRIIAEPETGLVPWVQPWGTAAIKAPLAMPRNAYRLQTDTGVRIIVRKVSAVCVANALEAGEPSLSPDDADTALIVSKTILDLAEGLQLRRVRVMGMDRIELAGFNDMMRDRLRTYRLFSEIISWKLRFFVPIDTTGPASLARVLERYPIARIADRAAP